MSSFPSNLLTLSLLLTIMATSGWGIHFKNFGTGQCLTGTDVSGITFTMSCNNNAHQQWDVVDVDDERIIINRATGECLDATIPGARPGTQPCAEGRLYQLWVQGTHLRNRQQAACLESGLGGFVWGTQCDEGIDAQKWNV